MVQTMFKPREISTLILHYVIVHYLVACHYNFGGKKSDMSSQMTTHTSKSFGFFVIERPKVAELHCASESIVCKI